MSGLLLTERDRRLLADLGSFRFLSVPQVAARYFNNRSTAEKRLRRLHQAGLLTRVFLPVRLDDRSSYSIYALSAAGSRIAAIELDGKRPPHVSPSQTRKALFLDHTIKRNDLRICLELLERETPLVKLLYWQQAENEVEICTTTGPEPDAKRVRIVPDGAFVLSEEGHETAYFVETDMGTVSLNRMADRFRAYHRWFQTGGASRFGYAPVRVLTVTHPKRIAALRRVARDAPGRGRGSGLFWFASFDDAADITDPISVLSPIWTVARRKPRDPEPLLG